jgi:hypothetical protein
MPAKYAPVGRVVGNATKIDIARPEAHYAPDRRHAPGRTAARATQAAPSACSEAQFDEVVFRADTGLGDDAPAGKSLH